MNPNSEIAVAKAVGGTGNLPVPGGYQPPGTGTATGLFPTNDSSIGSFPIPSGQWPDGTGRLPVPPILISESGFKQCRKPGGFVRACFAGKTGFTWPPITRSVDERKNLWN